MVGSPKGSSIFRTGLSASTPVPMKNGTAYFSKNGNMFQKQRARLEASSLLLKV